MKAYVSDRIIFKTLKSFHKEVTMYLRRSEYNLNDDYVQIRGQEKGSYYSITDKQTDIQEQIDDTIITIQIFQDPIVNQFERNIFTFLEMIGQLGGLYEILTVVTSFMIGQSYFSPFERINTTCKGSRAISIYFAFQLRNWRGTRNICSMRWQIQFFTIKAI